MNIPKLSPVQWFRLVAGLLPYLRGLVKATGLSVVAAIRALIDLVAQVESFFPPEFDAEGKPKKRGSEKAAALAELISAGFATADERIAAAEATVPAIAGVVGEATAAASVIVGLFNGWGIFKTNGGQTNA